jgi:hypothetical protein
MGLGNGVARVAAKISLLTELRTGATNQPQRGCSIQPSVGAQRLRWGNGQKENNSEGVVSGREMKKRWRATAVQDAGAFMVTPGWREASWSAPALWRFGRI